MFPSIHAAHRYVRPTSTTPLGQYDVMILIIALLQDLFWVPNPIPLPSLSFKRSQDLSRGTKYLYPYQIASGVGKGLAEGFVSLFGSWLTLGEPRHWAVVEQDVAATDSAK